MNTADYLLQNGADPQVVILGREKSYTYADLRQASARLAGELRATGVQPGDRVGLFGENSLFWVAAYLAMMKLEAVAVPFPTVTTVEDLQYKQAFFKIDLMCVDRRSQRKFSNAFASNTPLLTDEVLSRPGPTCWDPPKLDFDLCRDAAYMLTSGTTARPRAVRVTHQNIQANTDSICEYLTLSSADRILVILPFYYCFGTSLLHTHLRVGGSLSLCNTFAYPETALDQLAEHQCSGMAGVPSTYQTLLRNTTFARRGFTSLHKVQQAGGKLPEVFIKELVAALPDAQIFVMYGQTEATARLSYLPPERLGDKLGSIGRGIPGVALQVLDDAGQPVTPGAVGEIVARGDNISPGYLEEPEANAEKFIDGALRTGDLATVDEDGFIYIVDRKSDFIKTMGHRVSSQEVEACILRLTDIISAAAIGIPDPVQGEAIKAFVVLRKGANLAGDDILAHCRAHLPRHMVPKEVAFIDALPTNAHGKVVKAALKG